MIARETELPVASSIRAWFVDLASTQASTAEERLGKLEDLIRDAVQSRDRSSIEQAEDIASRWRASIMRRSTVPREWSSVVETVFATIRKGLTQTEAVRGMRSLDLVDFDVLLYFSDTSHAPEFELDELENGVLFPNKLDRLDSLGARGLLQNRWQLTTEYWSLSPLGFQTLSEVYGEIESIYKDLPRFLNIRRTDLADRFQVAAKKRREPRGQVGTVSLIAPTFLRAAIDWLDIIPLGSSRAWVVIQVSHKNRTVARYQRAELLSHLVGTARFGSPAELFEALRHTFGTIPSINELLWEKRLTLTKD
jgi:hypothetical protein